MKLSRLFICGLVTVVLVAGCADASPESVASPSPSVVEVVIDPDVSLEDQLLDAVRNGNVDFVNALVDAGVDIDADLSAGSTALHLAVQRDDLPLLMAIVAASPDLDKLNGSSNTALAIACQQGQSAGIIDALLTAGATHDIASTNQVGSFPIHACAGSGNPQAVETLVLHGIDPNMRQANFNATPIIVAAWSGDADMVELLLGLGADPLLEDNDGQNAYDWAYAYQRTDVIAVLESVGL